MTAHRFFRFNPRFGPNGTVGITNRGEWKTRMNWPWKLQLAQMATLVIDEISMLDGEFLEEIDALLRAVNVHRKDVPFGGVQVKKKYCHTREYVHT